MRVKQWTADIFLSEEGDRTKARVVLHGDTPHDLVGSGVAQRNPHDPSIPEIGDEVAAGRALGDLSARLLQIAYRDIDGLADDSFRID